MRAMLHRHHWRAHGLGRRPSWCGHGTFGAAAGEAGRAHRELGYEVQDLGNVTVAQPEAAPVGTWRARFLPEIAQTCTRLGDLVYRAVSEHKLPLVLGGDHSIAVGTVAGCPERTARREASSA